MHFQVWTDSKIKLEKFDYLTRGYGSFMRALSKKRFQIHAHRINLNPMEICGLGINTNGFIAL
jgi:hypothetical protein